MDTPVSVFGVFLARGRDVYPGTATEEIFLDGKDDEWLVTILLITSSTLL